MMIVPEVCILILMMTTVAMILLTFFGAGGYSAMLSIEVENLDALNHVAFCRDLHLVVHCVLSGNVWYF